MSASEKLRALPALFDPSDDRGHALSVYIRALPLIADVIEAAEHAREVEDYVISEYEPEGTRLQRALTALREHLEGGDVT